MPLMQCGCVSNATVGGRPVCAAHYGITGGAEMEADTPDLKGRQAKCSDCGKRKPSDTSLAFFRHRPEDSEDGFYCGCHGWN